MRFAPTVLFSFSLAIATVVFADVDSQVSPLGLRTKPVKLSKRSLPSLLDTRQSCQGTCQSCFGATFIDCPDSSVLCYDPADGQPSEACSASGSSTPTSPPAPSGTGIDSCSLRGASCQVCFGGDSTDCPAGSDYDCYDTSSYSESEGCYDGPAPPASPPVSSPASPPASPSSTVSTPPTPSSSSSSGECAQLYGPGNIDCGPSSCYNPDIGESCCPDGRYCSAGTQCIPGDGVYRCTDDDSPGSLTSSAARTPTSSGIINTTGSSFIVGGDTESTTTTASRVTRTTSTSSTSSRTSTEASPAAATQSTNGAALASLGKDTGAVAALGVGLLALAGIL